MSDAPVKCDVCDAQIADGQGYLLTTTQAISCPEFWTYLFSHQLSMVHSESNQAEFARNAVQFYSLLKNPWILCDSCAMKMDATSGELRNYAIEWWNNNKTFLPPGSGTASPIGLANAHSIVSKIFQRRDKNESDLSGPEVLSQMVDNIWTERQDDADSIYRQARDHEDQGQLNKALALYKYETMLRKEVNDESGVAHSLEKQGLILVGVNQPKDAFGLYQEAELIRRKLSDERALAFNLANQFTILKDFMDQPRMARLKGQKAYDFATKTGLDAAAPHIFNEIRDFILED